MDSLGVCLSFAPELFVNPFLNLFICLSHHLIFLLSGKILLLFHYTKRVRRWIFRTIEESQNCLQFLKHLNALFIYLFIYSQAKKAIEKLPIAYAFHCSYSYCGLKLLLLYTIYIFTYILCLGFKLHGIILLPLRNSWKLWYWGCWG